MICDAIVNSWNLLNLLSVKIELKELSKGNHKTMQVEEQNQKILLIDDSKVFIELEKNILGRSNYKLLEALNGKSGLEILRRELPNLILLDINMPIMNGFEFLIFMKNDEKIKDIPVIIVTAKGRESDVKYALKLGADDYITKPIDSILLLIKVNSMLSSIKRRISPRKNFEIPIKFNDFSNEFVGIICDLSMGGAMIDAEIHGDIKQKLEVEFIVPFEGGQRNIKCFGKILSCIPYTTPEKKGLSRLRIQFINVNREDLFFIDNLISQDFKAIASFIFSSPIQRKDYTDDFENQHENLESSLIMELNSILNDFYELESEKDKVSEKYQKLKNHIKEIQLEHRELAIKHLQIQEDYVALSNLFIAHYQLFNKDSGDLVLNTLNDILKNLAGVEEYDLLIHNSKKSKLISIFDGKNYSFDEFHPEIITTTLKGKIYFHENMDKQTEKDAPYAVIPLHLKQNIFGFIVIYRLLPQLINFPKVVRNLLFHLSIFLGNALYLAISKENNLIDSENFLEILEKKFNLS